MSQGTIGSFLEGREVIAAPSHLSVRDVAELMAKHAIGAVPVLQDERLVGVFSERDLLTRVVARGLDPASTLLDQVMTRDPQTVSEEETFHGALVMMQGGRFRHLPVVRGERVIGMISLRDVPMDVLARKHTFEAMRSRHSLDYLSPKGQ